MSALTWIVKNWRLALYGAAALIVGAAWWYVRHLRASVADLTGRLATATAVNSINLAALDTMKADHVAALAAIEADAVRAASRSRALADIEKDIRNAKIPEGACTSVGPRLGAALDGLRRLQAVGGNPDGTAASRQEPVDLRP